MATPLDPFDRRRFRGCLLGLAAGDALGTTLEFKPPGSFTPIEDIVGGGPFRLQPGQWTDDTAMALCLAESLVEQRRFDPAGQMQRYLLWYRAGRWSSTGRCFDIGNTTRASLERFERTGEPFSGPTGDHTAGNGSLMRLAPVAMFYARRPEQAIAYAADSSRTTHGARAAVDSCRWFAGVLVGALAGAAREELLAPCYSPVPGLWQREPLAAVVDDVASGSFRFREPLDIRGSGYAVKSLEAALWAFDRTCDFQQGALKAANLGDDADTTAAIYGQLAGAYYGEEGVPEEWRAKLALRADIERLADALFELSQA